jgi:hypothetical protein
MEARPGHSATCAVTSGLLKMKASNFILYSSNISKLRDVKFNILQQIANAQLFYA